MKTRRQMTAPLGFSLVEILMSLAILAVLASLVLAVGRQTRRRGGTGVSIVQLHGLAGANAAYAADHAGDFCPAMSRDNLVRWHGGRGSVGDEFDPARGFLSPYFGGSKAILVCPLLEKFVLESFEKGAGGYGYNAEYIGGTPDDRFRGASLGDVPNLGRTVMFATTALSQADGVQEYPFTEPRYWVDRRGRRRGELQPSTHFRANGRAIIAWGDGRVTLEPPTDEEGANFYGGNNKKDAVGWFGPGEENGFWNPNSPAARGQPGTNRKTGSVK
ncbi:MAG: type II secretion system protein [Verrucomicrobiales bacterium]